MKHIKQLICLLLTAALLGSGTALAAGGPSFTDASVNEDYAAFQAYYEENIKDNYTQVVLTPGKDETQLNVSYYSPLEGVPATPVVNISKNPDMSEAVSFQGRNTIAIDGYVSNFITVTGLEENTTYYYTTMNNGVESEVNVYRTFGYSDGYSFLFVGDPQIGSGGCCNDAYNWDRTLDIACARNPELSFILSAGDQVANEAGGTGNSVETLGDEEEFAAYLSASALRSLPVAPVVGNHDAHVKANGYHYYVPNQTDYGVTAGGSDYYFSYGNALFIVLNLNNYNCAEHEAAIQEAIEAYPDAVWRIGLWHQDVYGSGKTHGTRDSGILRTQITPLVDEYDIDVVLNGHDHVYSRSYMLENDGLEHPKYDFVDWYFGFGDYEHFYDSKGNIYNFFDEQFQKDNDCDVIVDTPDTTQVNPQGTVYITGNSASGSKYYNMLTDYQDYIAVKSQNYNPSYSVIHLTDTTFTIETYEIIDGETIQPLDETFTIMKVSNDAAAADNAVSSEEELAAPDSPVQTEPDTEFWVVVSMIVGSLAVVLLAAVICSRKGKKE